MKKMSLKGLVVAAMLASSLFVTAPQAFAEGPQPSVVTVTGYAQQEVAPDTAYITIGTSSTDTDAQQARTKNNQVMNNVTNAIKAMGIPADNLKTTGFYMSPNYDVKGSKVTSYTVTNSLTVKVSDLSLISQVISKAGSLGANQIDNIRFTNEHSDQIKDNLIKEAVHNGQRAAQAAAAGNQLGAVKEINISGSSPSYSRAYSNVRMLSAKMEDAETTPVEAGTNTLSQTVSLTYYLK
jgi:uncharacterized protein YggE